MSVAYALSIELNNELYERVKKVSEWSSEPIEKVFLEGMNWWYTNLRVEDVDAFMERFHTFSNVELWAVVYQRLPLEDQDRLSVLSQKNKTGQLASEEKKDLDELVDLIDYQMLLRSQALVILKNRGQDADGYFYGKNP